MRLKRTGRHAARIIVAVILAFVPSPSVVTRTVSAAPSPPLRCDGPLSTASITAVDPDYIDLLRLVQGWTVRQRVGHLFILGVSGTVFTDGLRERIENTTPAGVFLLGRNVQNRDQLGALVEGIRFTGRTATSGVGPFVATDFEGGTVNALRAITGPTPSAQQLAGGGEASVIARGVADAAVLRELGVNVNLAPVADIRPPDGGFIGSRAFATNAPTVATLATAYAHGLRAGGIVPVLKHFPGHGRASGDSHVLLPILSHDRVHLQAEDLLPFADALRAGEPGMVMVGHVLVPAIDPTSPASLSEPVVTGLLRHDLGFGGVVITDELKMRAVAEDHDVVQAATAALHAGVDLILSDYSATEHTRVVDALVAACDRGDLSGERLATALARVLHLKSSFGLLAPDAARRVEAWRAERQTGSLAFRGDDGTVDGRFFPTPVVIGPPTIGVGPGFTITDEQGIMLYRDYVNEGGAARLGRPLSRRFALGSDVVQLLEGGLLRWRPDTGACDLYDGFDLMAPAGIAPTTVEAWLDSNGWGNRGEAHVPAPKGVRALGAEGDNVGASAAFGASTDDAFALPPDDPLLGAATGPETHRDGWVIRRYVRGIARVAANQSPATTPRSDTNNASGANTADPGTTNIERILVGTIALAIEAFPPDAIGPLPWSPQPSAG